MRTLLLFFLLTLFSSTYAWETDYSKAREVSREDKKPLLLFFTGSDWSGLAMKMKNETLDSKDFQKKIGTQFHCIEIDFPIHTTLSSTVRQQNEALKSRFAVEEYPTLILLDSDEQIIVRMGYSPEGGQQLANELLHGMAQNIELCRGLKALPKDEAVLRRLYQLAQIMMRGEARSAIMSAGVEIEVPFFLVEQYRLFVEEGKDVTLLRQKLLKSNDHEIHFTVAMIDFQEGASKHQDPCEAIKPLEAYLEHFRDTDSQNIWRIEMMIAQFYLETDEWGVALKHAETAYKNAPTPFQPEIENSLHYIKSQIR